MIPGDQKRAGSVCFYRWRLVAFCKVRSGFWPLNFAVMRRNNRPERAILEIEKNIHKKQ